eukprot:2505555-Pyramimonas_sp.AAC.1
MPHTHRGHKDTPLDKLDTAPNHRANGTAPAPPPSATHARATTMRGGTGRRKTSRTRLPLRRSQPHIYR